MGAKQNLTRGINEALHHAYKGELEFHYITAACSVGEINARFQNAWQIHMTEGYSASN
jgi:hypothetical protein